MQFLGVKKWYSANVFSDTKQKHVCWKNYKVIKVSGCIARALFSMSSESRFVNETLAQVFSCEFCEISKNNFFTEETIFDKWKPLKVMKNAFYFTLKALFVLQIFKFLSRLFGHVEDGSIRKIRSDRQNPWRHDLVKKQLQYTYCPISQEVKATRQWNLVS